MPGNTGRYATGLSTGSPGYFISERFLFSGLTPSIPEGTVFCTYNDHRIAMACSLLGLGRGQRVAVDDPAVVRKSFPEFWNVWSALS